MNKKMFKGKIRFTKDSDLEKIREIFSTWMLSDKTGKTNQEEVEHYIHQVKQSINKSPDGQAFDWNFLVAENPDGEVIGIMGLRKPIPKLMIFTTTPNPAELNMAYIDKNYRGMGVGTSLINELEKMAKSKRYSEIIIRSAQRYKDTGWGFYDKLQGYERVGEIKEKENRYTQVWRKIL